MDIQDKILQGDALTVLKSLPEAAANCIMTSPPYWALRDYDSAGQLGLEKTFDKYIDKLCTIFDEAKRVLDPAGTCWVVIGDTYSRGSRPQTKRLDNIRTAPGAESPDVNVEYTEHDKCLCNIPARFSIEMCVRGWILRNVIIWHKRNCMPASVTDRFTVDFEYLFFFVKQKKYYFEQQFDTVTGNTHSRGNKLSPPKEKAKHESGHGYKGWTKSTPGIVDKKNKRAVWTINPKPYPEAHFAVYPEEICHTPIKAGCPAGGLVLDPFFGSGTTGLASKNLGRHYLGIELNPEYIKLAEKRLSQLYLL